MFPCLVLKSGRRTEPVQFRLQVGKVTSTTEMHQQHVYFLSLNSFNLKPSLKKGKCSAQLRFITYHEHKLHDTQKWELGLPWWHSGWESACQCRGHGFDPWSGKIPHAAEQLGPWATTTEPARLEPVLCNKRGRDSERPAHRDEEWPPLATTRESPRTETKTQHSHK